MQRIAAVMRLLSKEVPIANLSKPYDYEKDYPVDIHRMPGCIWYYFLLSGQGTFYVLYLYQPYGFDDYD